jgi:hypothetical protein
MTLWEDHAPKQVIESRGARILCSAGKFTAMSRRCLLWNKQYLLTRLKWNAYEKNKMNG